jgi:hypothetical protein
MPESNPVSPKPEQDTPTLMIGLGGTGANAAAYIKELIQKQTQSGEAKLPFVIIDTD